MREEQRRLPRLPLQLNAILHQDDENLGNCSLMDVSIDGAGILLNTQCTISAGNNITLLMDTVPHITEARGTVVWTKELARGAVFNCAAGIRFTPEAANDHSPIVEYALSQTQRYDRQWAEEKCLRK